MTVSTSTPSQLAAKFIHQTNRHIFLTGKAGTGKTTFLREITSQTYKNVIVAAPTGIAAINAGGVTLHSLFQLPFGAFIPENHSGFLENAKIHSPKDLIRNQQLSASKRKLLQELELLIIDEVSMLRSDLLDAIDVVLRSVRRNGNSFGGVQVLFIGDLLQLPPVVKEDEWKHLKNYYATPYFFDAVSLKQNKPLYIELDKIYRQQDNKFVTVLNHLRDNNVTQEDIQLLNQYVRPGFRASNGENYIHLTTHNYKADQLNREALAELKGKIFSYQALIDKDFPDYNYPIPASLELKVGAQVMFIKNDPSGNRRFFNGKIGVVDDLSTDEIIVKFEDGTTVEVEKYEWQNVKYKLNDTTNEIEESIEGTFTQYPLKLAWAITVHKSQGLTFEKAIIDIGQAFAPGQIYVALSRLTSLEGLVLTSKIPTENLLVDENISKYVSEKPESEYLENELEQLSETFFKNYLAKSFDFSRLQNILMEFLSEAPKDKARSVRAKYNPKLNEIEDELKETKETADKFLRQLNTLMQENNPEALAERVKKAKEHFEKSLRKSTTKIKVVMEEASKEKRVREFLTDLSELDRVFFKQIQQLQKAVAITDAYILKKDFTKETIHTKELNQEKLREEKVSVKKKKREKGEKKEKSKKIPTAKITYDFYKSGMTVEEICLERKFVRSTIIGHLSQFVASGELKAEDFVPADKLKNIRTAAATLENPTLSQVKELLGDEYGYDEIRMGLV